MYRIRFSPYSDNDTKRFMYNGLLCHRVYSTKLEDIEKFMRQHNFDMNDINIETLSDSFEDDDLDSHMLREYKMYSNKTKKIHNVFTSERFVSESVESTVQGLSDYLIFGNMIIRQDIPFVKLINDLIDNIPMIFAFDYDLLDGGPPVPPYNFNPTTEGGWLKLMEVEDGTYDPSDDSSLDDLYERFKMKITDTSPLPITLEAYIRYFVKHVITHSDRYN